MNVIEYCGNHYVFENTRDEPHDVFVRRTWFIVKNMAQYKHDPKYLENLSYIWSNVQELGVKYDQSIMAGLPSLPKRSWALAQGGGGRGNLGSPA